MNNSIEHTTEKFMKVGKTISETYNSFGIKVSVVDFYQMEEFIVFGILPEMGVRVSRIRSYKDDVSLRLGINVKIEVVPTKGHIGIYIPISYFFDLTATS